MATADLLVQQGAKATPSDATPHAEFGTSVALSADGQTALVGAPQDSDGVGAAWIFVRSGQSWVQQGLKLTPDDASGASGFGYAVALSADGGTALVGGELDGGSRGAAWVFTRGDRGWAQQGPKLLPSDPSGNLQDTLFGKSVALSADGGTALVGGWGDGYGYGAAWVFGRTGTTWAQESPKLTPDDEAVGSDGLGGWFGSSVALSADGSTALVGGEHDNAGAGAAWTFTRFGDTWAQIGGKLQPSDETGAGAFGSSVALSADGSTALVGGQEDANETGAAWAFVATGASWTQDGPKLTAPDEDGAGQFGDSVTLTGSGEGAAIGGVGDGGDAGAAWWFARTDTGWSASGLKLLPTDGTPYPWFGSTAATSSDGSTLLVGGSGDNVGDGALWSFAPADVPLTVPQLTVGFDSGGTAAWDSVFDQAQITGGDNPTGTVTFRLYGPNEPDCSGRPAAVATVPVAGNDLYFATLAVRQIGDYRDMISYSGDARNAARTTACGDTSYSVVADPHVSLTFSGSRAVGSPLHAALTLQNGADPTGDVTLRIYRPSDPTCSESPIFERMLTIQDGQVPVVDYMPPSVGTYYFGITYSGDPHNLPEDRACFVDEQVAIGRAKPTLTLAPSPATTVGSPVSAAAQLAGGYQPTGTVTFSVFAPSDPTCSGAPIGSVSAPLRDAGATSGAFATALSGLYRFTAEYAGDGSNLPATAPCGPAAVPVAKRRPMLSVSGTAAATDEGGAIEGTVVLDGAFQPSGNVVFDVFGPDDRTCARVPAMRLLVALSGAQASTGGLGPATPGSYELIARYDGDGNNAPVATRCGATRLRVPGVLLLDVTPRRSGVAVTLVCVGPAPRGCRGVAEIAASEQLRRGRVVRVGVPRRRASRVAILARARYALADTTRATVLLRLDRMGRALRREFQRLPVTVQISLGRFSGAGRMRLTLPGHR